MSFDTVKRLRAENRMEESYALSHQMLQKNPEDIWLKRSHAWSIYYMIKKHVQAGENQRAKLYLQQFDALQMPEDEKLLYERMAYFQKLLESDYLKIKQLIKEDKVSEAFDLQLSSDGDISEPLSWAMYYLLRALNKEKNQNWKEFLERWDAYRGRVKVEKKLVYKLIIQELIKVPEQTWAGLSQAETLEFFWLFQQLDQEDFEKAEVEGKKLISLAERLHISYSKALIRERSGAEKISAYITDVVEKELENYPSMQYVPYFKAKLLLSLGDREKGLHAFRPFAVKKQREFWVWQVYAEAFEEDKEMYLACLCRAMTCKTKPEFLCGIKERLVTFLIGEGDYALAKSELEDLLEVRERNGWGKRHHHVAWVHSGWYTKTDGKKLDYKELAKFSDQLLHEGIFEKRQALVTHVNKQKNVFGFLLGPGDSGFGKYSSVPEEGRVYELELKKGKKGFYEVRAAKLMDADHLIPGLMEKVSGRFKKIAGKKSGFVGNVFVSESDAAKYGLKEGEIIDGIAVANIVPGKNSLGWRILRVNKTD